MRLILAALLLVFCAACTQPQDATVTIFVGAALPPHEHSIVVVENGIITGLGPQASVPIPTGSRKISGLGRSIAPIDPAKPVRRGDEANFGLYSTSGTLIGRMIGPRWEPAQ